MKNIYDCIASIVVYNNPPEMLRNAIESVFNSKLNIKLYVFDNSPAPKLKSYLEKMGATYYFNEENIGYGKAHNWCIEHAEPSKYHIILNPDIIISEEVIEELIQYMDANPDVGIACPKVLNKDGSIQHLNRRHPTAFDFFLRRLLPNSFRPLFQKRLDYYVMKDVGYDTIYEVPFMTGAFMFCRTDVLKSVRGFDPRYFMYFEDADLSRKVQLQGYKTIYYPHVCVTHIWERASHKSVKMAFVFIANGIRYFNKWGWKIL